MTPHNSPLPILDQIELVKQAERWVAWFGAAKGAIMPIGAYCTSHLALDDFDPVRPLASPRLGALVVVTIACLMYSVTTVWQWQRQGTGSAWKATWYVVGLEGLMVFSPTLPLAIVALLLLIGINAIATACTLVRDKAKTEPKTVAEVARELSVPRAKAKAVLDRQLTAKARPA